MNTPSWRLFELGAVPLLSCHVAREVVEFKTGTRDKTGMVSEALHLFSTPVIRHRVAGADGLNRSLLAKIGAKRSADPAGIRRSNTGGWHSETDMMVWATEEAQRLFSEAMAAVAPLTADTNVPKRDFRFDGQMWANVSGPGHSNQSHCHTGALWSGVYYVEPGGDGVEGELILEDPRFPMTQMYMPGLVLRDAKGQPERSQFAVRPEAGLMVLFPSWLKHSVRPYKGETERVSVAFNLMVNVV